MGRGVLNQRDLSDPELAEHLQGFIGYVLQLDGEEMTQAKYYTMKHIERVKHQVALRWTKTIWMILWLGLSECDCVSALMGSVRAPNGA